MTSRRPMTRSFSGNGRTSSFSEEEGSSSNGRSESRNPYLSNVRPENSYSRYSHYRPTRSTLCSVMAQLTEDIQPSFETTLKSKAVSENCNVKFTCVVSGYPAPELKWYKDDMEMDRYCGLPKYEIRRNGKTHTLFIYNCTLDDAAIYQASASNSKGIVSCSGVLEVGVMNEYKIHQRFFAKLKHKADKKRKELDEQTRNESKENIQKEKPQSSPEPPPRKRPVPLPQEKLDVKQPEAMEQLGATAELNGISTEVKESGLEKKKSLSEEALSKKKIKISNGVDAAVNRSNMMGVGGENCYDGGIGLAQFLAETLQSNAVEEKENLYLAEKPKEVDIHIRNGSTDKEREQERIQKEKGEREETPEAESDKRGEMDLAIVREEKESKHVSEVKHHSKTNKDQDHHNIQTSLSSMLHTVKDFFFGKSKKDLYDHTDNKEREFDHVTTRPPQPETPPSFRLQSQYNPDVHTPFTEDMETDTPKESLVRVDAASLEMHEHKHNNSVSHRAPTPTHKLPPGSVETSSGQYVKEEGDIVEAIEVSVKSLIEEISLSGYQVPSEIEDKDSLVFSVIKEVPVNRQEPDCFVLSPHPNQQCARDESSPRKDMSVVPQTEVSNEEECSPTSALISLEASWTPPHNIISVSNSIGGAPTETQEMSVDKVGKKEKPDTEKDRYTHNKLCEEEKTEVKLSKQPCLDINRFEMTDKITFSLEERIEPYESNTPEQVLSPLAAVAAYSAERENVKEETKCTSPIQEANEAFPPTAASESLEKGDLKIQDECTTSSVEESTDTHCVSAIQSSSWSGSEKTREVLNFALEKDLEVNLCNNLKTEECAIGKGESAGVIDEKLHLEVETAKEIQALDEAKCRGNRGNYASEENSNIECRDSSEKELGWPLDNHNNPQKSATKDTSDITETVPHENQNKHFIIPKIEIMEPEFKECTLALSFLAINKSDLTHTSETIIQDQTMPDFLGLMPTPKDMQNDYNISVTEKVKEVAQLDDKTEMYEQEPQPVKSSEQLPQTDCASVPVTNVSCTDDKGDVTLINVHDSHPLQPSETPTAPLFVVPPISVSCHENDPALSLPTHSEWTETETDTQRGTKNDVSHDLPTKPENSQSTKQNVQEIDAEKCTNANTSFPLCEGLMPKVTDNVPFFCKTEHNMTEILALKPLTEIKIDNIMSLEELQKKKTVDRLTSKPPTHPSLSPASLRKFTSKAAPDSDSEVVKTVPIITVADHQSDKADEDVSGGSTPTSSLSCESSPRLRRRDSLSLIRSATPEELASGARRKIFIPKTKEDGEGTVVIALDIQSKKEAPYMSPSQARRAALLQAAPGQNTPPMERRSPLLSRRKATLEVPKVMEETPKEEPASTKREEKPAEKKPDPLKAPQVIRKIRGEPFPDASGHLKLWCQFFNVLSDSTIKWFRDEEEILEMKRSGGDESQVALAIVLASSQDCGVYGCSIKNEYGTDMTDFLLSVDILSEILLKDDLEVGEEIEMTPMVFNKGLADSGSWGDKFFGRIMTEAVNIGEGCSHKASKVKVIYGLDPVFESGSTCFIKVQNPITYGTKQESILAERNLQITKQECKVQNMIREYCKIFAAEARVSENFGCLLEVIPQYLMYRPANSVPYATVESALEGVFDKYCMMDPKGKLSTHTASEIVQKCSTFQHWIHQWTHGNLLVTRLEGVETKLTNIRVETKSKGYQGLTERGSPEIFEQFQTHHQCNYYCGLLGLRPLKTLESLQQSTKIKGSRSPLLNRKLGSNSPQTSRKPNCSPKAARKVQETEDNKSDTNPKVTETVALETR